MIADPFGNLLAKAKENMVISASEIIEGIGAEHILIAWSYVMPVTVGDRQVYNRLRLSINKWFSRSLLTR